ncbi:hypothetical protein [Saccharothrix xinjiangensis]|uniref:Uncharacterized protein n=1 Tax=Saccharothrix xinjiangensis TaxID=204798 RepID=A0ABV9Y0L3_9PSEU
MPGRIVTSYSYQGGTGRSMSLANTAWVPAANGLRVLVVDWDLEAPGLHRWFHPFLPDPALGSSVGLIDLIWEFASAAVDPAATRTVPTTSEAETRELLSRFHRAARDEPGGQASGTVVLLHPAEGARAARVPHGPPRYSAYSVLVLRLTRYGMRMVRAGLDLVSGEVTTEQRGYFRYDSLVSVTSSAQVDARGNPVRTPHLGLVDGESFDVVVAGVAGARPDEDPERLLALALEVSGATTALPVLERAVADGRLGAPPRIGQESRSTGPDPRLA